MFIDVYFRSKLGLYEKAIEDCNAALDAQPNHLKALLRRAHSYFKVFAEQLYCFTVPVYAFPLSSAIVQHVTKSLETAFSAHSSHLIFLNCTAVGEVERCVERL